MFAPADTPEPQGSVVVAAVHPDGVLMSELPSSGAQRPATTTLPPAANPAPPAPPDASPVPPLEPQAPVRGPATTEAPPAPTTTEVPPAPSTTEVPPPPPTTTPPPPPEEPAEPAARVPLPAALSAEHADGTQEGMVSWYDLPGSISGVCAHRTIEKGTVVTVTNLDTGKSITCTVDDRGPYSGDEKILDLHRDEFSQLAPLNQGVFSARLDW
ncbi:MAG TPA: septal ring lytic transglycosylase RlpA family protein [Acidimicrobiales bacterium]|nr:septal ring lytic transglycosylase RlpA family protein [Acidimicrobiales bacterium]